MHLTNKHQGRIKFIKKKKKIVHLIEMKNKMKLQSIIIDRARLLKNTEGGWVAGRGARDLQYVF